MSSGKIFLYAEYQVSIPFTEIDWKPINEDMQQFDGLVSKTWLSGINTHSVGGFYEFTSQEQAQKYIDGLLIPFGQKVNGNLTVKLFDGDVVAEASKGMSSPFF